MKTLEKLMLLAFLSIQTITISQNKSLEILSKKYNTSLKEQNKGIAILVKKDGKRSTLSLGNFHLTEHSLFNIGSATKTFTAILILQEKEKGNLKLSDSIGTYLKPIKNVDNSLTIQQLLTHESGLDEVIGKNIVEIFFAKEDAVYQENLLQKIEKNNPKMVGKFNYCNTNYFLLGKILEKITDQSYFDILRERIIEPLQLKNTHPYLHKNLPNLATPYHENKDVSEYLDYQFFANVAYAAGSVASTLYDMEQFYSALFETEKLLKKESLELMLKSGNETYGLGIFKSKFENQNYFGHGGNNIGYSFRNQYNPATKNLFMMFSNNISIPSRASIRKDLLSFLNNKPIEDFKSVDLNNFKKYTGTYLLKEANLELEIILEDNKMYIVVAAQGVKSELAQKDKNSVSDKLVGVVLSKIDGNTDSLKFNQNGFETTINRIKPKK
ncbi:beta-lactamase family protein [Polaribacter batillariae]|uniref:Beta-lactamase family protein n=1 Tax=Polaribacter batillariae TaxID=2808900 RepID=A0ABX7SXV5_9FLAO|nr:serine hydrolase domain-containing protein [Polaribacter batillariae]QTD39085.1 beta-lactamase family protein [Polaribacter batillariae]